MFAVRTRVPHLEPRRAGEQRARSAETVRRAVEIQGFSHTVLLWPLSDRRALPTVNPAPAHNRDLLRQPLVRSPTFGAYHSGAVDVNCSSGTLW